VPRDVLSITAPLMRCPRSGHRIIQPSPVVPTQRRSTDVAHPLNEYRRTAYPAVIGSVPGGVTGGSTVAGSAIGALLQPSPRRVQLSNGTFFGEIALLHRTKRSGTVTATRKTKLLALDAQDFHALIDRLPDLAAHVKDTAEARLADTAELLKGDLAPAEIAQAERD